MIHVIHPKLNLIQSVDPNVLSMLIVPLTRHVSAIVVSILVPEVVDIMLNVMYNRMYRIVNALKDITEILLNIAQLIHIFNHINLFLVVIIFAEQILSVAITEMR